MAYVVGVSISPSFQGLTWEEMRRFGQNFVDLCLENGATLEQIRDAVNVACNERDPQFLALALSQLEGNHGSERSTSDVENRA